MAQKGKAKKSQRDRTGGKFSENKEDPSRLTRVFRSREHMAYGNQGKRGESEREELVRQLRVPYRSIVLDEK